MIPSILGFAFGSGGGGGISIQRLTKTLALLQTAGFLILPWTSQLARAQSSSSVGYGPRFDACGDSCQTSLLHFCTVLRDAHQQHDCWCGVGDLSGQYTTRAAACVAGCDPGTTETEVQMDQILRYRNVVCKGSAKDDPEFAQYYQTRYDGQFTPDATAAAPPATVTIKKTSTSTSTSKHTSSTSAPARPTIKPSTMATSTTQASSIRSSSTSTAVPTATASSMTGGALRSSKKRLSGGAIVGISLGVLVAFVGLLVPAAVLAKRRRRQQSEKRVSPSPDSYMGGSTYYSPTSPHPYLSPLTARRLSKTFSKTIVPSKRFSRRFSKQWNLDLETDRIQRSIRSWLPWNLDRDSLSIQEIPSRRPTLQYRDSSGTMAPTVGAIRGSDASLGDRESLILPPTPGIRLDNITVPPLFSGYRPTIRQVDPSSTDVRNQQDFSYFGYHDDEEEASPSEDSCTSWGSQSFIYEDDEERTWDPDLVTPIENMGRLR